MCREVAGSLRLLEATRAPRGEWEGTRGQWAREGAAQGRVVGKSC
jgi:hypothetical protein